MQPSSPTKIVDLLYDCWLSGKPEDMERFFSHLSPEIEWNLSWRMTPPDTRVTQEPSSLKGKEAVKKFLLHLRPLLQLTCIQPEKIVACEANQNVFAWGSGAAKVGATGKSFSTRWAHRWTFDQNRQISQFEEFVVNSAICEAFTP